MTTKILLVDDHPIVRHGYRALLDAYGGMSVVAEAGSPLAAVRAARRIFIDVAVVDLRLPGAGGIRLCQRLRRAAPHIRLIVFSAQSDYVTVRAVSEAGAMAFLDKRACAEALPEAVLAVAHGRVDFAGNALAMLRGDARRLSQREEVIVRRFAAGETTHDIALALSISPKTVANHIDAARDKLHLESTAAVIRYGVDAAAPRVEAVA